MADETSQPSIEAVKDRLEEIVEAVSDESIDLDEALSLYEEAVALGLSACQVSADAVIAAAEASEEDADEPEEAPPASEMPNETQGGSQG